MDSVDSLKEHDEQCINFSCSIPVVCGRGFIEVLFFLKCLLCIFFYPCSMFSSLVPKYSCYI